jgi:hypothetical protein
MITIKCAKCKTKLFRYLKIGKGQVRHLWPSRIQEDLSIHDGEVIKCPCGNEIGKDEEKYINLKRSAFTHTGRKFG